MSKIAKLEKSSENIHETSDLQANIVNNNSIPVEQEILNLKETTELINCKIKVIKVSDVPVKQKNYENLDIKIVKQESFTDLFYLQCTDNVIQNILLSTFTPKCLKRNFSEDPAFEIYKQKVIEMLELHKNNCQHTIQLYERQEEVLWETLKISLLLEKHNKFSNKLKEKSIQYQKECEENVSDIYKKQMETVQSRIQKTNFMRVIISRLLGFVNHNWMENTELDTELKELFILTKSPVSVNSLLKE